MTAGATSLEIEQLEALGHRTWPALEDATLCGWLVRAARGHTRRANSVNPTGPPTCPTDKAIESTTAWLAERGLPPIFRLIPTSPEGLDARLAERGFIRHEGATIMTAVIESQPLDQDVEMATQRAEEWTNVLLDRQHASRAAVERVLDTQTLPTVYGLMRRANQAVAVGMAVIDGTDASVFNMRTRDAFRRQGLGTQVLRAILGAAFELGARRGFLQVMPSNTAAVNLYAAHGYAPRYDYWYRQLPQG